MPRRLNFTGRKKINRADARISLVSSEGKLSFSADLRLADYDLAKITPRPRVFVEAYVGASTHWKRFDFGLIGQVQPPADCSLQGFPSSDGVLFRVKVVSAGEVAGMLVAEADHITPRRPEELDDDVSPLIRHVSAEDIGDELWRLDFSDDLPLLKINSKVPNGADQFIMEPKLRAIFAPAIMRQVLTRILVRDRDAGDEDDPEDWRSRWVKFAEGLPKTSSCPGVVSKDNGNLDEVESWIDDSVEAFARATSLLDRFVANDKETVE
ncbi:MAG: hypothetical protein IT452_20280 [Planctomycetia bacterium]|nr:hypothetical protein [Planctomycetia bacterium]